jgi:membrane-associated phospholipid phosphatase
MVVTLAYFAYLTAMAVGKRRAVPLAVSLATLACVMIVGMRSVMPLIYLLIGYWVPALLVGTVHVPLEKRLLAIDHALFGPQGLHAFARQAPHAVLEYFELAYLLCYAVVPAGFAWLVVNGFEHRVEAYWSTVLLASFACYGPLPWLPTRAPRAVEPALPRPPSVIRAVNLAVLDRASVQWNTFPSGHTAASAGAALAVGSVSPAAGVALGVVAVSIAIGSVVGRYHYAADAIAGAFVAIAAFVIASAVLAP